MVPKDTARVPSLESISIAICEKTHMMKLRILRWELFQDYQRHTKCNTHPWKRETERDSAYQHEKHCGHGDRERCVETSKHKTIIRRRLDSALKPRGKLSFPEMLVQHHDSHFKFLASKIGQV